MKTKGRRKTVADRVADGLFCISLLCLILAWRGPSWLRILEPKTYDECHFVPDFFQEWASAKNFLGDRPVYAPHEATLPLYLGEHKRPNDDVFTKINAHPPASVLLAVPFGLLGYDKAFVAWNTLSFVLLGISIWLVLHSLGLNTSVRTGTVILVLLLFCHPLWSHVQQGQLSILLLFLITLCWVLCRSDHPWRGGAVLGIAAAVKLFPAFLFLPLILSRRWKAVVAGMISFIGMNAITIAVLGFDTCRDYVHDVLPTLGIYRGACHNLSLCGVWYKLFAPTPHWMPITLTTDAAYPVVAFSGYVLTVGVVLVLLLWLAFHNRKDFDLVFSASIVVMVLVSPITWDHYLLLLVLPAILLWRRLPRASIAWPVYLFVIALLFVEPLSIMRHGLTLTGAARSPETGHWLAAPLDTLTAISVPCYAIVGLFIFMLCAPRQADSSCPLDDRLDEF